MISRFGCWHLCLNTELGQRHRTKSVFSPADLAADNIVAISSLPASLGKTFHVTRDTYATMQDITTIMGRLIGYSFTNFTLKDFVSEVIERCQKDDLLFPLLNFLVRSIDNITSMEFKRYDNKNFQRFRDRVPNGKEDPPLEDVVAGILCFMGRHGVAEDVHLMKTGFRLKQTVKEHVLCRIEQQKSAWLLSVSAGPGCNISKAMPLIRDQKLSLSAI